MILIKKFSTGNRLQALILSLYSPIGYLRTDIFGIDQASLFHLISLSFPLISFIPILFFVTLKHHLLTVAAKSWIKTLKQTIQYKKHTNGLY